MVRDRQVLAERVEVATRQHPADLDANSGLPIVVSYTRRSRWCGSRRPSRAARICRVAPRLAAPTTSCWARSSGNAFSNAVRRPGRRASRNVTGSRSTRRAAYASASSDARSSHCTSSTATSSRSPSARARSAESTAREITWGSGGRSVGSARYSATSSARSCGAGHGRELLAGDTVEQVDQPGERQARLRLARPRHEHPEPGLAGGRQAVLPQAGLADPGLPLQHERPAGRLASRQEGANGLELALARDEKPGVHCGILAVFTGPAATRFPAAAASWSGRHQVELHHVDRVVAVRCRPHAQRRRLHAALARWRRRGAGRLDDRLRRPIFDNLGESSAPRTRSCWAAAPTTTGSTSGRLGRTVPLVHQQHAEARLHLPAAGAEWANTTVVDGSAEDHVRELKQAAGGDIGVHGSIRLARSLGAAGLVDEYRLVVSEHRGRLGRAAVHRRGPEADAPAARRHHDRWWVALPALRHRLVGDPRCWRESTGTPPTSTWSCRT